MLSISGIAWVAEPLLPLIVTPYAPLYEALCVKALHLRFGVTEGRLN
jgi:hypothetical protein